MSTRTILSVPAAYLCRDSPAHPRVSAAFRPRQPPTISRVLLGSSSSNNARFRSSQRRRRHQPLSTVAAASSSVPPEVESFKSAFAAVLRDPWDTLPRSWRTFWAVKLAATVVSADDEAKQVQVTPVETLNLKPPQSVEDALHRLRTNAVLYRQNYVVILVASLALTALRQRTGFLHLATVAAAVVYALCSSDKLLGEASLASQGRFVWNAKRVAGVDRAIILSAAPVVAFLTIAASPTAALRWIVGGALLAVFVSAAHAVLRPVDLESTFAQIWGDIAAVRNRDDVASAMRSAGSGLTRWWTSFKSEPADRPPPVIIVRRGGTEEDQQETSGSGRPSPPKPAPPPARPRLPPGNNGSNKR